MHIYHASCLVDCSMLVVSNNMVGSVGFESALSWNGYMKEVMEELNPTIKAEEEDEEKKEIVKGKLNANVRCLSITEPNVDEDKDAYMTDVLAQYQKNLVERTSNQLGDCCACACIFLYVCMWQRFSYSRTICFLVNVYFMS